MQSQEWQDQVMEGIDDLLLGHLVVSKGRSDVSASQLSPRCLTTPGNDIHSFEVTTGRPPRAVYHAIHLLAAGRLHQRSRSSPA